MRSIARIVPAPQPERIVEVHYPAAWIAPGNPHMAGAERAIGRWFREIGVIHDGETAERFRRMNVGGYGGLPFPRARPEALEVFASLLSLWIFYDDAIEGLGADDEEALLSALAGEAAAARSDDSPCLRGFRELGGRLAGRMSPAWMRRHADDFARWLLSVREEALLLRRFRAERNGERTAIGVEQYMAVRRFNVGMIPVIDWIEYDLGRELPAAMREHPAMSILVEAACRAVAFGNDLYGYTKDREARFINAVACAEREDQSAAGPAFARIAALHDEAVEEMELVGRALIADAADRPLIIAWLERLGHIVAGFGRWHGSTPRYAERHLDETDGSAVVLRLVATA